ncbi:MAG: hypothetical protein WBK28_03305 [Minisyncoccia bacterium]
MEIGAILYYAILIGVCAIGAYLLLFKVVPSIIRSAHELSADEKGEEAPPVSSPPRVAVPVPPPSPVSVSPRRTFSAHEGFKSLQSGKELTEEDIVTGLSRH